MFTRSDFSRAERGAVSGHVMTEVEILAYDSRELRALCASHFASKRVTLKLIPRATAIDLDPVDRDPMENVVWMDFGRPDGVPPTGAPAAAALRAA